MKYQPLILICLWALLSACGALDESSSDDSDSSPSAARLTGLWMGNTEEQGTTEAIPTQLLFYADNVYVLREDEAQIGTYEVLNNGRAALDSEVFTYATPDIENQFYIGTRSSDRFTMDALFATSQDLFINYDGNMRSGSITLAIDSGRVNKLDLNRVRGTWGTQDSVLYINDEGGLQGSNSATGCQWKGKLSPLSSEFLSLEIERKLCTEFNQNIGSPITGIAIIDGEGKLHFIAEEGNNLLWMRFESETGTTPTEPPDV